MRARHLLLVAVGVGVAGCQLPPQNPKPPTETRAEVAPAPAAPATAPTAVQAPEDPAAAEAARRKAENYVKEMQEIAAGKSPDDHPAAATQPSTSPVIITDIPPATRPAAVAPPLPTTAPVAVALAPTTPAPAAPVHATPAPSPTDVLERQLRRRIKDNPLDLAAQFDWQLLLMLRGGQVPELETLTPLPADDRETVVALMDCLANYRATAASADNLLTAKKVRPILELADRVRARAELSVPTVALCSAVQGFGKYEPMPATFPAGAEAKTIVYCEVDNFSSRLDDQRMYETRLAQTMTLYDDAGHEVWKDPQRPVIDRSRARQHDFFVPRIVKLPATLTPGHYTLKVTIIDQAAQRVAEGTTTVSIVTATK